MSTALTIADDFAAPDLNFGVPAPTPYEPAPRALNKRQKAAIIVRLLLAEGADLSLTELPDGLQAELCHQMADMRFVDRTTLKSVIDEFVAEIEEVGLSFMGGIEGALDILDGKISPATAARVRKMAGVKIHGNPWETLSGIDPEKLLPVLTEESPEIAAVLLSKIKVSTAAELLGKIPGTKARKIAYAVSLTGDIDPEVVEKIGQSLASQLDAQPVSAFEDGPVARVGAILNFSPAATRDEVLDGLEEDDRTFADEVRKAIFTFANIPARIDPRDIPKIAKDIEQDVLIMALAAATPTLPEAVEFILSALSKRMAEQIREEMQELGAVKASDGEAAMASVVATIRAKETAGELLFLAEDEE